MKSSAFILLICLIACRPTSKKDALATLPTFNILMLDSSTVVKTQEIPTGGPIVLFYFRPDCPHCRQEMQDVISHIDSFKAVRFYFVTMAPLQDIKKFYLNNHLDRYKNITVGKDDGHSFFKMFRPSTVPYLAIYDSNKKLVNIFNGGVGIDYIVKVTRS